MGSDQNNRHSIIISAVIITYNDAERIQPCLESIRWVDEIVVVDLGSTDSTVAICREFTDFIYSHEWVPYADPIRDEALALARGQWILMLDPDERVSPTLASKLRAIAACDDVDVVLIPFWHMLFGYKRTDPLAVADAIPRFFRKGVLEWPPEVHARPNLERLRRLKLDPKEGCYILHNGWRTTDEVLDKIDRYTHVEAEALYRQGVRFSVARLLGEMLRELGRGVVYQAHLSGTPGLIGSLFMVFYRFMVMARLWELEGLPRSEDGKVSRWGGYFSVLPRVLFRIARVLGWVGPSRTRT